MGRTGGRVTRERAGGPVVTGGVAERDRLAARVAELEAENAGLRGGQERKTAPVEPRVRVRWTRDSPDGGANVGGATYTGTGPVYTRARGPGGREYETLARLGEEVELPIGHAQALCESGVVEPASDRDAEWLAYDALLHGGLVGPGVRRDPETRRLLHAYGRAHPVPAGWPAATYAELHPP